MDENWALPPGIVVFIDGIRHAADCVPGVQCPCHERIEEVRVDVRANDETTWWVDNNLHRGRDQPAVVFGNGDEEWYTQGVRHRDGGHPAVVRVNGHKEWWVGGVQVAPAPPPPAPAPAPAPPPPPPPPTPTRLIGEPALTAMQNLYVLLWHGLWEWKKVCIYRNRKS